MNRDRSPLRLTAIIATVVALALPLRAQDEILPAPELAITKIDVQPSDPGPDTLCRLAVTVRNSGEQKASQLGFSVKVNGQDLRVYGNQLFMYAVPADGELEIPLYNFWTTETSRPEMPADGKYRIEISLLEAEWMDISVEKEMVDRAGQQVEEEVEVWTPLGAVPGLPVSADVTLDAGSG